MTELRRLLGDRLDVEIRFDPSNLGSLIVLHPERKTPYRVPCLRPDYSVLDAKGLPVPGLLGHPLNPRYLRLARPRVCPDCVREVGFIPAWTDLAIVDACPTHRRELVTCCPACKAPIRWFRPGLLTCRCGSDLAKADCRPISFAHASFLSAVASKVTRTPYTDESSAHPLRHISEMTLHGLVRLVHVLTRFGKVVGATTPAATAAHVLSNWPHNFHEWLTTHSADFSPDLNSAGLRKQFENFYCSLFKGETRDSEMSFVRDAFIQFGRERWGLAQLDKRLIAHNDDHKTGRFCLKPPKQRKWFMPME